MCGRSAIGQTGRDHLSVLHEPLRDKVPGRQVQKREETVKTFILPGSLVLLACLSPALAQEMPSEAKFSITYTSINPSPSKVVSLGDRDVSVSSNVMTGINDGGSGLLHNMPGRCNFMTDLNKAAKTIQVHGYCNYVDKAGDQVFEEFMTDGPASLGSPIVFKGKWLGGTGKFEGLTGDIDIRPTSILATETLVQGVGKKTGTYRITKSPMAQK